MRRWTFYFILIALPALGLTGCAGNLATRAETATPLTEPVTVAAGRGEVVKSVTAPGQLVGTREVVLSLPVGGHLIELSVRPGSVVQTGDTLARLDPAPFEASAERAQIALNEALAEHAHQVAALQLATEGNQALVEQARAQALPLTAAEIRLQEATEAEQRALSEYNKALDRPWEPADVVEGYRLEYVGAQRRREVAAAELIAAQNHQWAVGEEVAARQAELARAEADMTYLAQKGVDPMLTIALRDARSALAATILTAPFDGVILEVSVRAGETTGAGQPLVLLADPSSAEVQTTVIEEDLPLVQPGQAAELFFDAQPDAAVAASVDRIVPRRIVGEERPLYIVYLALSDGVPTGVFPGMTVDASILIESRADVVRLPRALVRGGDESATVDIWRDGRRESRTVTVGLRGDVYTEIIAGLSEGEQVVAE